MLTEAREYLDQLPCRKLGVIVVREKVERGDYHRYRYYKEGDDRTPFVGPLSMLDRM
jgi:hypothetical protein